MDQEKKPVNVPKKIARITLKVVLYIFLFVAFIFILLLTPPVQRLLTSKVETYLQNKLKTRVEIGRISFGLSGKVGLNDVFIEDRSKDTLLSGGTIRAHINFMKLFSNEIEIKDLEVQNITAKIKRELPDTVFNFQFIVDAFITDDKKNPDTAQSPPMKLDISDLALENINLHYIDVITGNNVRARIGNASATIDTLDPYTQHFVIPTIIGRNIQATVVQTKPLIQSEPLSKDLADAAVPTTMNLSLGTIDLSKIAINYSNDVSAMYTTMNIGQLKLTQKMMDLAHNKIYLDDATLNNSKIAIRLGKKEQAKVVAKEVKQEITAQKTAGWDFRVANINLANNSFTFDNDNNPKQATGMDFGHIQSDSLNFFANDFVMNTDSVGLVVTKASMKEKSGFRLTDFQGDILYANNQTYFKNLLIKTPGTEIKRTAILEYPSIETVTKDLSKLTMNIELVDSRIQVKDILTFAPQLRSNPALSNPNDVWYVNIIGNGTLNRLFFEKLQFSGLKNTQLNAQGTLTGLMDPKNAGGNFTIYKFHTTQSDIALFTGSRLSTKQINLPEDINLAGTVIGNAGTLNTNLSLSTSAGAASLRGRFSNLTSPATASYNGTLRAVNVQLGSIMRQPDVYGNLTGTVSFNGRGLTPDAINTKFNGNISSVGYNKYQYHNIKLNGSLHQTAFAVNADINDPNIDLNMTASGNFSSNPSFAFNGTVDSIKTLPLHLTPQEFIFRGDINGTVANMSADNLDASLLITKALFVSNGSRLNLDTVQLNSGTNSAGNFIDFRSDIINASLAGQYKISELGSIIQNTIQPYFSVAPAKAMAVHPYQFHFTADAEYSPILSAFVPGLTTMEPVHAEGSFASDSGMTATLTTKHIVYNGNDVTNVNIKANTAADGLHVSGLVGHIKSGSSFDVFNTRLNATALNNNIDFNLGIDDQSGRNKYYLAGLVSQPATGTYAIQLKPDSLLLNYDKWTVPQNNQIVISPTNITAQNFALQLGNQSLTLNSLGGSGQQPLQVNFSNFQLATLTGFVKSDSLLVNGTVNGEVTLRNLMTQPVFTSNLTINDLSLRQDTIGNVNAQVSSSASNRYTTNVTVSGRGNDIALTGYFTPGDDGIALNLDLAVRALQLNTMEGALASAITDASGTVSGNVAIRGTSTKPGIQGDLNFNNTNFIITALGSRFKIDNEKLSVSQDGLVFDNFTIRDSSNNNLTIDGNILTANFINYDFDLDVNALNFEALNSRKTQNSLYYGKLNITTSLHIGGTETKPVVDGTLSVNKGTALNILVPQQEPGVVEREGVVSFVDMDAPGNDSLFRNYDTLNRTSVLGMDVTMNIDISKEANFNIIVDAANGDFLNVRGEGQLSSGIDPSGKITLVGTYTLEEGAYQLSFNFLQRRFDIQKGSTIVWTGEPTSAQLNITAVYVANTAPLDLVAAQISAPTPAIRNTYLQKLPFEVHLNLTGEMMKPVVGFDILLPENKNYGVANDIVTAVQSRLGQLRQDEGEINKQVFSLLLLGRFVGENPFESSGGGFNAGTYARQSVSKLLTEQLNSLAGGLVAGVDINFDVTSADDYTTGSRRNRTDLNVGLSKRLLNDRLKVTVGSNFQLEGPQNSNQGSNNIAGNIALDYQLSKDGRYLLRFYRQNQYEGVVDGYIIETGLGFILSVDYNRFYQVLHRRKQRVTSNGNDSTSTNTK